MRLPEEIMSTGGHQTENTGSKAKTPSRLLSEGGKTWLDNRDPRLVWPQSTSLKRQARWVETPLRRAEQEGARARREIMEANFVRPVPGSQDGTQERVPLAVQSLFVYIHHQLISVAGSAQVPRA